jgi:hypothetical protein
VAVSRRRVAPARARGPGPCHRLEATGRSVCGRPTGSCRLTGVCRGPTATCNRPAVVRSARGSPIGLLSSDRVTLLEKFENARYS